MHTVEKKSPGWYLLNLRAAFNTDDHDKLLEQLENWVRLSGAELDWFESDLKDRDFFVYM